MVLALLSTMLSSGLLLPVSLLSILISMVLALLSTMLSSGLLLLVPWTRKKAARPATRAETVTMTRPILMATMFFCCLDFLAASITAVPALSLSGNFSKPDRFD